MALITSVLLLFVINSARAGFESECSRVLIDRRISVNCSNARLTSIPQSLDAECKDLDLSHNRLERLLNYTFAKAKLFDVETLNLSSNRITFIASEAFTGTNLRELDLSNNNLRTITTGSISKWVVEVNLNGNPLKRLYRGYFSSPNLRWLSLERCAIDHIRPDAFFDAVDLQTLSLRDNLLTSLNEAVFQNQEQLIALRVEGNPWICDCKLESFWNWYDQYDEGKVTCQSPANLNGTTWKALASSDLVCT